MPSQRAVPPTKPRAKPGARAKQKAQEAAQATTALEPAPEYLQERPRPNGGPGAPILELTELGVNTLCRHMASNPQGPNLRAACEAMGLDHVLVYKRMADQPGVRAAVELAREIGFSCLVEDTVPLAMKATDRDSAAAAKVQVDSIHKLAAVLGGARFQSNRNVTHRGDPSAPVTHAHYVLVPPKKPAPESIIDAEVVVTDAAPAPVVPDSALFRRILGGKAGT